MSKKMKKLIGKPVIIRARDAGVHFGTLESVDGQVVMLSDARRLWRFWCAESISLTGVALHGLADREEVQICGTIDLMAIRGWCEIIPVAKKAAKNIADYREASQ